MERNNGQTIFLSVIGIATLLVAIIGATFAYFATSMSGNAADVSVTTGTVGSVSFTAQGFDASSDTVLPGWTSTEKTVTVEATATDYPIDYACYLNVSSQTSTFEDLVVSTRSSGLVSELNRVKVNTATSRTKTVADGTGTASVSVNSIKIAQGTFTANASTQTNTHYYTVEFEETGVNQNAQQADSFVGTVTCELNSFEVYYDTEASTGTTTKPTAY